MLNLTPSGMCQSRRSRPADIKLVENFRLKKEGKKKALSKNAEMLFLKFSCIYTQSVSVFGRLKKLAAAAVSIKHVRSRRVVKNLDENKGEDKESDEGAEEKEEND